MLGPTFEERGTEPFAIGGFSDVYEATLNGRLVAIKILKVTTTTDLEKLHRVSSSVPKPFKVIAHTGP
jgi:predicted unusual protein kinase regulating ubiquinone biosynthesis (AarF/ABC1/UbiB family)